MGESPTAKDDNGDAPIHLAASLGYGLIVGHLVSEGAEVDELDHIGFTPLQSASCSGDYLSVRILLAAGACPRRRHGYMDLCAFDFAVGSANGGAIEALLEEGVDVNARGRTGRGCLHQAADKNRVGVIQPLAEKYGVEVDCTDEGGITPLHLAATEGHLPAVNALISAGADISLRTNAGYSSGFGPFNGGGDWSAFNCAADAGHVDILKALVRHGAGVTVGSSNGDLTPLHHAAAANRLDAMRFLLDKGADADAGTGWKPIHFAVEANSAEALQVLTQHGADVSGIDEDGWSSLESAAEKLNFDMVEVLLAAGANPNPPDEDTTPVLQRAIKSDARSEEVVKLLLKHGADVNGADSAGETALHRAMRHGTVGVVDLLIEAGAAIEGYYHDYPSPLQVACGAHAHGYGFLEVTSCDVVNALLGHGASVNLRDDDGNTPLHYASRTRSAERVDLLLRAGADESIVNVDGETPAGLVKCTLPGHARHEELSKPVLILLDGAPADRAWRRRGLLVLCRAYPDKARLAPERTRVTLPRAAKRRAASGGGREGAGDELAVATSDSAFRRVVLELFRVAEEGIFRKVICFL